uniref:Acid-sensing ion channel 1 n=1 Tax=Strix occidentalis caurina TaxID=311401 RepID=A0A8D0EMW6_STROC
MGGSYTPWQRDVRSLPSSPSLGTCDAPAPQQRPCSLEEFAGRSSLHGIQHIFQHQRYTVRNLLWLLAFLGSLGLLVHAYAKCMGLYFQYPHNTQLEEETVRNKTFPAVTLCNLNPVRFLQLSGHDLYWAGEMLGLLDGAGRPLVPESVEGSRLEALLETLAMSEEEKSRPFDLEEFYGRVGHQLDLGGMLVSCMFGDEECNSSDFQTVSAQWQDVPSWGTGRGGYSTCASTHSPGHCWGADKGITGPGAWGSGKGKAARGQALQAVRLPGLTWGLSGLG